MYQDFTRFESFRYHKNTFNFRIKLNRIQMKCYNKSEDIFKIKIQFSQFEQMKNVF